MLNFRFLSYYYVAFFENPNFETKSRYHSKLIDYTSQCKEYELLFPIISKYSELGASWKSVDFQGTFAIFCKYLVLIYLNQQYECE